MWKFVLIFLVFLLANFVNGTIHVLLYAEQGQFASAAARLAMMVAVIALVFWAYRTLRDA
jgi:hypothetical protein